MQRLLWVASLLVACSYTSINASSGAHIKQLSDFPWLRAIQDPAVVNELQGIADVDRNASVGTLFAAGFGPNSDLANNPVGWTAVAFMNKGVLNHGGCTAAPKTCAVLGRLGQHLAPRANAEQVGVRLLKLAAGTTLRPHIGPGGRLVAHLGIRVPPSGSSLTVAGETVHWTEGNIVIFDDSAVHSSVNHAATSRYILHVTFPWASATTGVIHTIRTPYAKLETSSDCSVVVTNLRNNITSLPEPLAMLYNKVADAHPVNLDPCISASVVNGNTLRLTASHGYGTLDLSVTAGKEWIVFQIVDLSSWNADPEQKHLVLPALCPSDICPPDCAPPKCTVGAGHPASINAAPFTNGRFQGFRGSEGQYPDSAGYFTISSMWQSYSTWMFAEQGQKLVYTLCPTASLSQLRTELRKAEGIAPPSANRAKTWWWVEGTEANLNQTIADAKSMGVELLFYDSMLSNCGDYEVSAAWPSGLKAAADTIKANGLDVGLHMISSGAQTCHGSPTPDAPGCAKAVTEHPEVFVPQGLAPRDWYWAQTAGTWWCHEMTGDTCKDQTRLGSGCATNHTPGCSGHVYPPGSNISLRGATNMSDYWSKLGRFRSGGAARFDGTSTFGITSHELEFNFTSNIYYEAKGMIGGGVNQSSEFSLQMVVHPIGSTTGKRQVLANKPGEWQLSINAKGILEWAVSLSGKMTVATGTTVLQSQVAGAAATGYVVKATHAGGTVKVFVCKLEADFNCQMPSPDGQAAGALPLDSGTSDITWGAESGSIVSDSGIGTVMNGFNGAIEEAFLYKMSLENVNAYLFACPDTGCINWHIFDYSRPAARDFWANGTSRLFNDVGCQASQWDGAEFQPSISGWDLPHSANTINSGIKMGSFWTSSTLEAFAASRQLWNQETAVEMSMTFGGLGPWRSDMSPFSDEGNIVGSKCGPAGDSWHENILLRILKDGILFNGYNTNIALFEDEQGDCFVGGLVACGIGLQITGVTPGKGDPTLMARAKYWNDLYKMHGQATESSITALHYPDIFLVGLEGGTSALPSYGLYAGLSDISVPLPALADNATILAYKGVSAKCINVTMDASVGTAVTFFAANNLTLDLSGTFWAKPVAQTVTALNGTKTTTNVTSGGINLGLTLGETVLFQGNLNM